MNISDWIKFAIYIFVGAFSLRMFYPTQPLANRGNIMNVLLSPITLVAILGEKAAYYIKNRFNIDNKDWFI